MITLRQKVKHREKRERGEGGREGEGESSQWETHRKLTKIEMRLKYCKR